jgi:hypothetical protein
MPYLDLGRGCYFSQVSLGELIVTAEGPDCLALVTEALERLDYAATALAIVVGTSWDYELKSVAVNQEPSLPTRLGYEDTPDDERITHTQAVRVREFFTALSEARRLPVAASRAIDDLRRAWRGSEVESWVIALYRALDEVKTHFGSWDRMHGSLGLASGFSKPVRSIRDSRRIAHAARGESSDKVTAQEIGECREIAEVVVLRFLQFLGKSKAGSGVDVHHE